MSDTRLEDHFEPRHAGVWMRGAQMLLFAVLFSVAETVLFVLALMQFGWMLFARERNSAIAEFGHSLGGWLAQVADFQSGASDDKPFPFRSWGG